MPVTSIGLGDLCKVREIKTLGKSRDAEARKLLEDVAKQVQPIMMKRKWRVNVLSEFCPRNPSLLGLNVGGGAEVKIRLRRPNRETEFYPYESLLGTMLHELTHNEHGPHDAKFYKLLDEITNECEELMAKGISGSGQGFDAPGKRLGGFSHNPPLSSLRQNALAAAEKRSRLGTLVPSGPNRIGGNREMMKLLTPSQAAAMAAEKRLMDDIWCAAPVTVGVDGVQKASERESSFDGSSSSTAAIENQTSAKEGREREDIFHFSSISSTRSERESSFDGSSSSTAAIENQTSANEGREREDIFHGSSISSTRSENQMNKNEGDSTWECGICTLFNPPLALVCGACGSQKSREKLQMWSCRTCTLENPGNMDRCSACEQWRYSFGPPVSARAPNVGT